MYENVGACEAPRTVEGEVTVWVPQEKTIRCLDPWASSGTGLAGECEAATYTMDQ